MPQPFPAVPSSIVVARTLRRAFAVAGTGMALTAAGASAASGGGAEAGDPGVAPVPTSAASDAAAPTRAIVRSVQRRLHLRADGVYGPRTRAAVRRFQRRRGLAADGRLGPGTLEALGVTGRAARVSPAREPSADATRLLEAIAQCESGGDPTKISADGRYRGKYQFDVSTWESMGGTGDPAAAPEAEQDRRAGALLAAEGTKPWPVCGKQAPSGR